MQDKLVHDFYPGVYSRLESLRERCARLEKLILALILILALSVLASIVRAREISEPSVPGKAVHGDSCTWANGETVYYANYKDQTPTYRQFRRYCEKNGGRHRWIP